MAVLSLLALAGALYSLVLGVLTSRTYFGVEKNRAFVRLTPDIDPPLWRVALGHVTGLLATILWLFRWPSVTEVWMTLCLAPALVVPYPIVLNNMLEWVMYLIFGNAQGDGSHQPVASSDNGAPPLRWQNPKQIIIELFGAIGAAISTVKTWLSMMWRGRQVGIVNYNHALLCYLQSETWGEMHHLDEDILQQFPTPDPNSRVNAVMMARCATMAYDRWHNIDQTVGLKWSKAPTDGKFSLLKAWSFDRVTPPSDLEKKLQEARFETDSAAAAAEITPVGAPPTETAAAAYDLADGTTTAATLQEKLKVAVEKALAVLRDLRKKVTAGREKFIHNTLKGLQWVVWKAARKSGDPSEEPLFDEDKTTSINTDAFLMKAVSGPPGNKVVALVLAFRGTEALQTVDWITDFSKAQPPPDAMDPTAFPYGFTHQGFRNSLGLKKDLSPADGLVAGTDPKDRFKNSYLTYDPLPRPTDLPGSTLEQRNAALSPGGGWMTSTQGSDTSIQTAQGWAEGSQRRHKENETQKGSEVKAESPFTIITQELESVITSVKDDLGKDTIFKIFVTGHSLGAALAHIYTGALLLPRPKSPAAKEVAAHFEAVYTFGEPRVGGQVFVTLTENALRAVKGPGGVMAEDRYKRVVNTLDIIPRIPPPLGELYQHPGHCTYIKAHFAIARPDLAPGATAAAAPAAAAAAGVAGPSAAAGVADRAGPSSAAAAEVQDAPSKNAPSTGGPRKIVSRKGSRQVSEAAALAAEADRATVPAAPAAPAAAAVADSSYSPVTNLIETPDMFIGPTILTVGLKLLLAALLLLSAAVQKFGWGWAAAAAVILWPITLAALAVGSVVLIVAAAAAAGLGLISLGAYIFWPNMFDTIWHPFLKQISVSLRMLWGALTQPQAQPGRPKPSLLSNPMYLIARLAALTGPGPVALLLDLVLLPFVLFMPLLWWTLITEPILLLMAFIFMPPAIISGVIDHSMAEYYTACWLTTEADWKTAVATRA